MPTRSASRGTMTRFQEFPAEIRGKVWKYASCHPNKIFFGIKRIQVRKTDGVVYADDDHNARREKLFNGNLIESRDGCRSTAHYTIPGMLHANYESRHYAMKVYRLYFNWQLYLRALWFNPDVDIVIFERSEAAACLLSGGAWDRKWESAIEWLPAGRRYLPVMKTLVFPKFWHNEPENFAVKFKGVENLIIQKWSGDAGKVDMNDREVGVVRRFQAKNLPVPAVKFLFPGQMKQAGYVLEHELMKARMAKVKATKNARIAAKGKIQKPTKIQRKRTSTSAVPRRSSRIQALLAEL